MEETRLLFGRKEIFTDVEQITNENIVQVLKDSFSVHISNMSDINYLYNYYKGKQPILQKKRETREEINHKVVENRANEIVNFYLGYVFGEPIQYIRRGKDDNITDALNHLNDLMEYSGKASCDREIAEWLYIAGVGYRMILPNKDDDVCPFGVYSLDPRYTYVVRRNSLKQEPVMSVKYVVLEDGKTILYSVYTDDMYYEIKEDKIVKLEPHVLGANPIIEYVANKGRLGAFEIVLPLLDAINEVQSNRLDDVVQHVNSFLAMFGAELNDQIVADIKKWKMFSLPQGSDTKHVSNPLDQMGVQTLADSLYQNVLTICGIPNRNGGSSTSDTGSAVYLRDGWSGAETRAKGLEDSFKKSERLFIRLLLKILASTDDGTPLSPLNIEVKFARRYTDNLNTKIQVLQGALQAGISPEIAIHTCGIWNDPTDVYMQSKEYLKKWDIETEDEVDTYKDTFIDKTVE